MEKSLRKDANINSGLILGFSLITLIIGQFVIRAVYNYYGVPTDNPSISPDENRAIIISNIIYNLIKYIVFLPLLVVIARALKQGGENSLRKSFCKPKVGAGKIVKWMFISFFVIYAVSILSTMLFMAIEKAFGVSLRSADLNTDGSAFGGIAVTIMTVIMAPILEEILFRGVLLRNLEKYGGYLAVIYSGVMFGLWHTNYSQLFFTIAGGLCFSFMMVKTGSIFPSMILHLCLNFFGNFVSLFPDGSPEDSGFNPVFMYLILTVIVIIGFILFVITLIKSRDDFKLENNCKELTTSRKFIGLWLAPLTIAAVAVFIGLTIYNALR
ncbi:MAG: CPBP family intramembrane metalloprotease [Ruminococcus sp.]|jgi:membrane protease YdiL (CAAX protease family)|nr:CPBP family intramembrane metalloprotease [Ruminococcus sp.]